MPLPFFNELIEVEALAGAQLRRIAQQICARSGDSRRKPGRPILLPPHYWLNFSYFRSKGFFFAVITLARASRQLLAKFYPGANEVAISVVERGF